MQQPYVHENLMFFVEHLANISYQQANWDGGPHPETTVVFSDIRHFLFDDTIFADDPEGCIGLCLRNREEADAVMLIIASINSLTAKYGRSLPDSAYTSTPEWSAVLDAATAGLAVLSAPDE